MVNLTVDDLIRFQTAGVQHEAEINAAQAQAAAAQLFADRYARIRAAIDNKNDARKLKIIQRLIQANSATDFDAFMDNLGA